MPHAIEIIGEATSRVSRPFCAVHPETPWSEVTGLRHRIVHDYFALDYGRPSETVHNDLPPLIRQLQRILEDWTSPETVDSQDEKIVFSDRRFTCG